MNSTVNRLDELTKSLNEGKGTAGQLLHDKQLYDNMNSARERAERADRGDPEGPEEVPERPGQHFLSDEGAIDGT